MGIIVLEVVFKNMASQTQKIVIVLEGKQTQNIVIE